MKIADNENPKERFKRLATYRTNVILDKVRILGNCSNRQLYEYQAEDVEKMFKVIEQELKLTKAKFHMNGKRKFEL
ncbi:MAG: hypothetical protein WC604_02190 [Candidatus Gracilibacteria bacterium]